MKLDIEPIKDTQLEYLILTRELPVRVMSTAMSPVRITRTREYLADGNGDLIFIINQTGKATTSARDPVFANCRSEKARHLIPSRAVLCSVRARLSVLSRESN